MTRNRETDETRALYLLKIPSAAEILAFDRIGVRSGHA